MKTRLTKVLVLLAVIAALVATMAMPAAAATTVTVLDGKVSVADSANSNTESNGVVTIQAKGTIFGKKTNNVTITNATADKATVSFDYTASNADSFTIAGTSVTASGSYSVVLDGGAKLAVVLVSKYNSTAKLTLSNFTYAVVSSSSDVTISYDSTKGSVTAASSTVDSGTVVESVTLADGIALSATPNSGIKFLAWTNAETGEVLSTAASFTLYPTENMTARPVFTNSSTAAVFWANGTSYLFESLDAATAYASSASNKIITLASDGTLPAGNYTIPAGVTLNIPYDAVGTLCTTKPTMQENAYTTPSVFRTLNMANGANLTVNGTLSLSAQMSSKYGYNGAPSGPLPFIKMAENSKITVENDAAMYVYGFVTGSGSVEVKSGGTVYECFQIADYRGGDATSTIVGKDDEYGVFPFNQYYIQNVEVPMTIHAGATEYGFTALYVTYAGVQESDVPFIGSDNSMFVLDSGYIVKDYLEGTGRTDVKIYGDVSVSTMSMSMKVNLIGNLTIDSSKYALPIAQHLTISVESGNISMDQSVAFLPGSELYIKEGATCTLGSGKKIVVYDLDQWLYNNGANGYSGTTNLPYMKAKYVPGGDGIEGRLKDALVQVDGTVNASSGALYVTEGGANIYSTGTGKITMTPGTETITYQVITNDTDVGSWPPITIKPAVLKDADGTDVNATEAGTYTYYASTGKWCTPSHRYEATVVAPTCTEAGYTAHTCIACGKSYNDTEKAATGHSYESTVTAPTCTESGYTTHTCSVCGYSYEDSEVNALEHTVETLPAVEATCTETGLTEGASCTRCGEVLTAQEVIPALGHEEEVIAGTAATCTETGLTEGKHCSACGEVLVAQEVIPALGHKEVADAAVAATCTATGLTEGKHCSVCGEVILAQEETPALGHKEVIDAAVAATCTTTGLTEGKHCSVCGEKTVPQEVVAALGHTEVIDAAVAATCTTAGLTEGKHCSVCGEVLIAQEEIPANGHSWDEGNVTYATCQNAGYTTYTCTVCGEEWVTDHVEKKDHAMEGIVLQEPTCEEPGVGGHFCIICETVQPGTYELPATGHSYGEWSVIDPTYTEAGEKSHTCSVCGKTEKETIGILEDPVSTWGISLHDNIGVRFALDLAEGDTVAITVNGETADVVKDENGYYCVYVAAAQMTDEIAISVNNLPLADTYSVRKYANIIISGDYDDATKNLVKYMLVYGGAAQNYFVYNNNAPENLASNGITVDSKAVPGKAPNAQTVAGKISGVKFYGASLVYRNKIAVRFYFTGDVSELTFTVNGASQKVAAAEEMSYVEIANILPQDLDEQITLTVSNGTDNLTVTYGPLNYIVRMNEKGSENLQALVLAMYNYYLVAEAYSIDN